MPKKSKGVDRRFGRRLKAIRERSGATLAELADQIGVHMQTLSKLERSVIQPKWWTVVALSRALDVPLEEFLPEDERMAGK